MGDEMARLGHWVSHTTIAHLLEKMNYSLKANVKRLAGSDHPDRNTQFEYIASQKTIFQQAGLPIISVDTKKKEQIGNFKNPGREWCLEARAVSDHDFEQDALGKAVPYGIYDVFHNHGYVYVGQSADTPEFAVDVIVRWWREFGKSLFPNANKILILADAGGSNGCRPRLWKKQLQESCWLTNSVWKSRFVITQPALPNGTRSNIVCLAQFTQTGLASRYSLLTSCWLAFVVQIRIPV